MEKILQSCETEGLASVWESKAGKYHSAMLGLHPDRLGLHPDGLGLHPDRLGLHPDGLGLHPDGLGLYLDGLGYRAPQNSQKIDSLLKKIVLYKIFYRFLCTKPVFTRFVCFSIDFSRNFDEKLMKKTICFFTSALVFFFSSWRPSRNTVFYNTNATFSFFEFLRFSKKKRQKTCSKIATTFFRSTINKT